MTPWCHGTVAPTRYCGHEVEAMSASDTRLSRTRDGDFCPVRATLALIGQKWVPRILYELRDERRRFNDLAAMVGGCNSRTLRDRLRDLEELGLVERREVAVNPPWVEYALTERGHELAASLGPISSWGRRHMHGEVAQAFARQADGPRDGLHDRHQERQGA